MKTLTQITLSLITAALMAGCAAKTPQLTTAAIMQQYSSINALNAQLDAAKSAGVDYLAPESYNKAYKIYNEAFDTARDQKEGAEKLAQQGLGILQKSVTQANSNRAIMQEVVDARQKAIDAAAATLYADKFAKLESRLKKSTTALEHHDLKEGKAERIELIQAYAALELASLQDTTTEQAEKAIAAAKKAEADDYAPTTFKLAEESLALATNILSAGRTQTQKASLQVREATYLANKSIQITKLAKEHKKESFEALMFWYQKQLETLNAPLQDKLSFDQDNAAVVAQIRDQIAEQIRLKNEAEASLTASTQRNTELTQELQTMKTLHAKEVGDIELKYTQQITGLTAQIKGSEASFKQQISDIQETNRKAQERYDQIAQMFTAQEANVYRQGNNVLLETHAFNFEVGKSEIGTQNFGLLEKILDATRKFANPHLLVMGHTDSSGSAELNMKLSQKRAEAVAEFFTKIGKIDADKIEAKGYGKTHPVASNENAEGRERNRRIEVLIINN